MRKPEQKVWDALKAHAPHGVRLERIENGIGSGTADVYLLCLGSSVWFEIKALMVPANNSTPIIKRDTFEKDQPKWHISIATYGGRSYVVARDSEGQWYLVPGKDIPKLLHAPRPPTTAPARVQGPVTPPKGMTRAELRARYAVAGLPELFKRVFPQKYQTPARPAPVKVHGCTYEN